MTDQTADDAGERDLPEFLRGRVITIGGGARYLEVKWRLWWLRHDDPDAVVTTEHVTLNDQVAIFKATVARTAGGSATGYGSETPGDFRDYIEKAEQKAIGRALAALGYGTQFLASEGAVVDAPVTRPGANREPFVGGGPRSLPVENGAPPLATPKQVAFLRAMTREAGVSDEALLDHIRATFDRDRMEELTRMEMSGAIEWAQSRRAALTR